MLRSEKLSQSIPLPDHNHDVIVGQPLNKVRVIYTPLPEQSRLQLWIWTTAYVTIFSNIKST